MASDKIALSANALLALETWLPFDLTPAQLEKVMQAAELMGTVVWQESAIASLARDRMYRDANKRAAQLRESAGSDE